jgi:hypothetical protein
VITARNKEEVPVRDGQMRKRDRPITLRIIG